MGTVEKTQLIPAALTHCVQAINLLLMASPSPGSLPPSQGPLIISSFLVSASSVSFSFLSWVPAHCPPNISKSGAEKEWLNTLWYIHTMVYCVAVMNS